MEHAWKACKHESVSWVRIPPPPILLRKSGESEPMIWLTGGFEVRSLRRISPQCSPSVARGNPTSSVALSTIALFGGCTRFHRILRFSCRFFFSAIFCCHRNLGLSFVFLFVRSAFCIRLSSDFISRWTPLLSLMVLLTRVRKGLSPFSLTACRPHECQYIVLTLIICWYIIKI